MKTIDVLQAAKAKIADEKNWTKGYIYGIKRGHDLRGVNDLSDADCFCSIGAVAAAVGVPKSQLISNRGELRTQDWDSINGRVLRGKELLDFLWPDAKRWQLEAMDRAAKYLNAAAVTLAQKEPKLKKLGYRMEYAYEVNDEGGHEIAMQVFDLAIKNAKRRHVNGGRTAKAVAK